MYSVISPQGQSYGPVDLYTVKVWCQEGRIHSDTMMVDPIDGTTKRAQDLPEVAQHILPPAPTATRMPTYSDISFPSYSHPSIQYPRPTLYGAPVKSKLAAILLGFFLGPLGIHRFYLGHIWSGLAMLLITVISAGTLAPITGLWAVIDMVLIATGALRDSNNRPLKWP